MLDIDRDLNRKFVTVAMKRVDSDGLAEKSSLAALPKRGQPRLMHSPKSLWDYQSGNTLAEGFLAGPSKKLLAADVPIRDIAGGIHDESGVELFTRIGRFVGFCVHIGDHVSNAILESQREGLKSSETG